MRMQDIDLGAARDNEYYPVSIVIASLGADILMDTIKSINNGTRLVKEILVCFPPNHIDNKREMGYGNIKILTSPSRGQVAQRSFGLSLTTQPIVVQMDDDVLIDLDSIKIMMLELEKLGRKNVISPVFKNYEDYDYITKHYTGLRGLYNSIYLTIVCGAPWGTKRMGKLTRSGLAYWVDVNKTGENAFETEWVPGGCVMCYREDLITDNYFPFKGKAYNEDVIHSISWRRNGCRLWAIPNASCITRIDNVDQEIRSVISQYKIYKHIVEMIDGSHVRLNIWYFFHLIKVSYLKFIKLLNR